MLCRERGREGGREGGRERGGGRGREREREREGEREGEGERDSEKYDWRIAIRGRWRGPGTTDAVYSRTHDATRSSDIIS